RVAGDQERRAEGRELDRSREDRNQRQPNGRAPKQKQPGDIRDERGDLAGEVEPGPGRVAFEQAAVAGDERRIVRPGRGDAEGDAGKREQPGAEDGGVTASRQAEVVEGVAESVEVRSAAAAEAWAEVASAPAAGCAAVAAARSEGAVASAVASRSTPRRSNR